MTEKYYVEVYSNGNTYWYAWSGEERKLHRLDGPAVEYADGRRAWYQNGRPHRTDGPVIEYPDGYRAWYQNGLLHRLDGPAIERPDGYRAWYINGKELTETEWQQTVASMERV